MIQNALGLYHVKNKFEFLNEDHVGLLSMVDRSGKLSRVRLGISKFGKGLFADETILNGSLITTITGYPMNFIEAVSLGEKESYPFQVGISEYIAPDRNAMWQYINHSCDPNCGVNEHLEIVAIREIKIGEELFYDYSTTMLERHWTMPCQCNSENCRRIIADFDTLLPGKQKYYLGIDMVQKYIKAYLYDRIIKNHAD
jgi:hypothetical protein